MKQALVYIIYILSCAAFLIITGLILVAVTLFPKRFF